MKVKNLHPWEVTYHQAVAIQERLQKKLRSKPLRKDVGLVAGADISYNRKSPDLYAAVLVMRLPELEIVETQLVKAKATFPYIPGLLSFRELPAVVRAFEKLKTVPDAVLCDGQGIAHPRGFGLAAHLGLLLDLPAAGCAKTLLVGECKRVADRRWSKADLIYKDAVVGTVLRTRAGVKPVYVSPGHKIDLEGSVALVRQCVGKYRLPEPTRQAHLIVNEFRREGGPPLRGGPQ